LYYHIYTETESQQLYTSCNDEFLKSWTKWVVSTFLLNYIQISWLKFPFDILIWRFCGCDFCVI